MCDSVLNVEECCVTIQEHTHRIPIECVSPSPHSIRLRESKLTQSKNNNIKRHQLKANPAAACKHFKYRGD